MLQSQNFLVDKLLELIVLRRNSEFLKKIETEVLRSINWT